MEMHQFKRWAENHGDVFADFVRIYLGIGLIVKGIFFMVHRDYLLKLLQDSGT